MVKILSDQSISNARYKQTITPSQMIAKNVVYVGASSEEQFSYAGMGLYAMCYEAIMDAKGRDQSMKMVIYDLLKHVYDVYSDVDDYHMYMMRYVHEHTSHEWTELFTSKIYNLFKVSDRTIGQNWDDQIQKIRHTIYGHLWNARINALMTNVDDFHGLIYIYPGHGINSKYCTTIPVFGFCNIVGIQFACII